MKIKIFSYVFWPEQFLINELAEVFQRQDLSVEVITGLPNYPQGHFFEGYGLTKGPYEESWKSVPIHRYPVIPRGKGFLRLALNYVSHLISSSIRALTLPKGDWAFVFATSPVTTAIPAILWAKLKGAKVCIWLQDLWPDSVVAVGASGQKSLVFRTLAELVRWIYARTDLILIQSPGFEGNLKEYGYRGPSFCVPNWAPDFDFKNLERPSWLELESDSFVVTFAGNVGKAQGIDVILNAAKYLNQFPKIKFWIVGDGSEWENAKAFAAENKLRNVNFFGRRPLSDMPALFSASDALLVSLKKDDLFAKTIPSKVQAYMAAARPLIGSMDGVGNQLIHQAQAGYCVAAEDSLGLAESIKRMSELSSEAREEFARNARSYYFKNFTKDRIISQIVHYLEQFR